MNARVRGVTVREMLADCGGPLQLAPVSSVKDAERKILVSEINRPGLALSGFLRHFRAERVQIIGRGEHGYCMEAPAGPLRSTLKRMLSQKEVPCVIVTNGHKPAPVLAQVCRQERVPLLSTTLDTAGFVGELSTYLEDRIAPSATIHGVLVDVYGLGVLIQGDPGIGKSECALELLKRGHILVSDDIVEVRHKRGNMLMGYCPDALRHYMEVRGLGIIDVKLLFGIGSILNQARIEQVVYLQSADQDRPVDRLGLDTEMIRILDVEVPQVRIPVRPGRNLAVIIEVAALNQRLRSQGIIAAQDFQDRLLKKMARPAPAKKAAKGAP